MMQHGDPMRRSADHGEAYGASIKDGIHRRTLRRKKAERATVHRRRGADGAVIKEWTQRALGVSRVMQVWRDMVVRDRLLTDAASTPFLQRHHYETKETGFAQAAAACAGPKGVPASVYLKVKEARENA